MDHLSLHVMVRALDTPDKQDLRKLQLLKDELVRLFVCLCTFTAQLSFPTNHAYASIFPQGVHLLFIVNPVTQTK